MTPEENADKSARQRFDAGSTYEIRMIDPSSEFELTTALR
jgi:hypothetical protein